jgi:hypothetical protein
MTLLRSLLGRLTTPPSKLLIAGLVACAPCVTALADESEGWPREIQIESAEAVIYQPQLESFAGNQLRGRAAMSLRMPGAEDPVFGTAWLEARVDTDLDTRLVTLRSLEVPRVRFAGATEAEQASIASLLEKHIPEWNLEMSLDRLLAGMEEIEEREQTAAGFDNSPPEILTAQSPTVLVTIDGEPKFWPISGSELQSVVNSAFFIVQAQSGGPLYLYAGNETWYTANELTGEWQVATKVPEEVLAHQPEEPVFDGEEEPELEAAEDAAPVDESPPAILVATKPSELILTDGKPSYKPIGQGELLYIDNTDSDVLLEIENQQHFVLLAGRWFSSRSLTEGPWTYVAADALPASFARIPEESEAGHMLAWVAGTDMANEVALDAYVPQTAAIKRDATIEVSYDGEPKFEEVEQTTLMYAVNTQSQVIQSGTTYYCVHEGVWYVAASAKGPWKVATEVPEEIQDIPASSPVYNTKYVYIYESTPEVVYVGYYPGYAHCYYYHGCLVYGTGWWYRPYWRRGYYYPRHSTWGFHVRYNPYSGWSLGLSWSNGPFTFTIGRGGVHGWFGPAWRHSYRRGYRRGYNRGWQNGFRQGARAGYRAGQRSNSRNIYNDRSNRARNARPAQRPSTGGGRPGAGTGRPSTGTTPRPGNDKARVADRAQQSPKTSKERSNNVYSDRAGNVHKREKDGSWQSRENGSWKSQDRSGRDKPSGGNPSGGKPSGTKPSTGQQPKTRPATPSQPSRQPSTQQQQLNRSHQSRQRGTQRSQGSRGSTRSRGGGGRRR